MNYNSVDQFLAAINALTFPSKRNYVKFWLYKRDEVICKGLYLEEVAKIFNINVNDVFPYIQENGFVKYEEVDETCFKIAKKIYHTRIEEINLLFRDYLFEFYGVHGKKAEMLFDMCKAYTGENISYDIENLFSAFVDLIR